MKPLYIFYSVARSGSSPIAAILGRYLNERHGHIYLNEYFNNNFTGLTFESDAIRADRQTFSPIDPDFPEKEMSKIAEMRLYNLLDRLSNTRQTYSLKVFPAVHRLIGSQYQLLNPFAKLIFIRRRDTFDHLLSYLLSFATLRFYESEGIKVQKQSVIAQESDFQNFTNSIGILLHQISLQPRRPVVFYEDLLEGGPQCVVRRAKFKGDIDWSGLSLPKKQSPENKLELFKNSEQILSWYRTSSLSRI